MKTAHVAALCLLVAGSIVFLGIKDTTAIQAQMSCDLDCVNSRLSSLTNRVAALEQRLAPAKSSSAAKTRETFVTLGGGSLFTNDWTKLPGSDFWLDLSLYGNVTQVTWQGWIEEGMGQARLYDSTNNRAVDGSEVGVTGGVRASFYSQPISIWRGQNLYYIQLKNPAVGTITITSPRLRIVTK